MEQLKEFSEMDKLLGLKKFPEAIKRMRSWSKGWLNHFYQNYPHHYELLKHDNFAEFWAERRVALNPKFTFVAQPNIMDIDFVLGYVFYLLALGAENRNSEEEFIDYIQRAIQFNSIHAAQTYFHKVLMSETHDVVKKRRHLLLFYLIGNYWLPNMVHLVFFY